MLEILTVRESTLKWLQEQAIGPIAEKTFEPEVLSFFDHINGFFDIPWGLMFAQVVLIAGIGVCGYVAAVAVDQKPIGSMIVLVTVACCISSIAQCLAG